ncbi:MAG TPA: thermonuclease family protein [Candidimonas sp.]|nr:thermonuclease family protein [Candidimonas sp.]
MSALLNTLAYRLRVRHSAWRGAIALAMVAVAWSLAPASQAQNRLLPNAGPANTAYTLTGRVVRVSDGDTFNLLVNGKEQRIRMASIDAPEIKKDRQRPGQDQAQASRQALSALIAGKMLTLACFERDRYDRYICDVPLADGMTANQKQVAAGMAWANMEGRGKFMRDPGIPALEEQARNQRAGIWRHEKPVRPWVWRYQCWRQQQC